MYDLVVLINFLASWWKIFVFVCRFRICALFSDCTGVIAIVLQDAELKMLTGKTVFEVTLDETEVCSILVDFMLCIFPRPMCTTCKMKLYVCYLNYFHCRN